MKPPRFDLSQMLFSKVYSLYVQKAERKGRAKSEVDQLIRWLTGYDQPSLDGQIERQANFRDFFAEAPRLHPHRNLIKGVICGVRIEEIEDEATQNVRRLDKLIDELSKGRPLEKIMRTASA